MPEDLAEQVPYIHKVTELNGYSRKWISKGYEADDLDWKSWLIGPKIKKLKWFVISSDKRLCSVGGCSCKTL